MDEYLRFERAIFCSSNCNFLRFYAHNLSLLLIFFFIYIFILNNVFTNYHIKVKYLPSKFNVMFKFNYSKHNPRGLIFGGWVYTWKEFPFQKLVPKRRGAYTRWGLLSKIYGLYA